MKDDIKKKAGFLHSTSAAFPWQPFSQHRRCRERLWCRVRIFDKVVATQKKAKRGYREKEKRRERNGVAGGDKRMSDLG